MAVRRHGEGVLRRGESVIDRPASRTSSGLPPRKLHLPQTPEPQAKVGENTEGFDGTVASLVRCYRTDEDSPFQKLRFRSRQTYSYFLKYIEEDIGPESVASLDARRLKEIHAHWLQRGVSMAHGLMGQLRGLATFGASILADKGCLELKTQLSLLKFKVAKPRKEKMTREMVVSVIQKAHENRRPSIALAQALQFEAQLRQKDVIGDWLPEEEPGESEVSARRKKWVQGIQWSQIDENYVLRHVTSLGENKIEVPLADKPLVMAELNEIIRQKGALPKEGPVIVSEETNRPYSAQAFRRTWRDFATAAGIPQNIRNLDSVEKADWYVAGTKKRTFPMRPAREVVG
jgi:hypothetical protein